MQDTFPLQYPRRSKSFSIHGGSLKVSNTPHSLSAPTCTSSVRHTTSTQAGAPSTGTYFEDASLMPLAATSHAPSRTPVPVRTIRHLVRVDHRSRGLDRCPLRNSLGLLISTFLFRRRQTVPRTSGAALLERACGYSLPRKAPDCWGSALPRF